MKKISYLCSTYLISCATLAHANIFSPDTHLSVYTKSTTSVAESSDFIKLAAVYPLSGNGGMTFKAPKATSCAAGYESYNGKCIKKCDRKTYPFASQPSTVKGTFSSCTGLTTYYGYTACNNGWTLNNHDCIENPCDGYVPQADLSHCQTAGGNICYRGSTAVYKCSTCDAGWVLNASGICVETSCPSDDYPYPSNPGEDAGKVKSCQSGERTWYGYESCNSGWVKSGSYCNKATCDTTAYPYTTQGQAAGCKSIQECKSGSDSYYGCGSSGCKSGYIADGKQCMLCSWDDNALDACPEHGVCTSKTCGGTTKYTLNSCEGGESTQLTCNVGDIYYSDDTCSPDVISGKTPIGVVYDTEHKLVISLNEKRGSWGNVTENDDTELENFTNVTAAKTDLNGKSNTDILVLLRNHPAANYCHNMTTGSKTWYLPAFGEMQLMSNSAVNSKLGTVGTSFASSSYYWSSTEHHYPSAWYFNPVNGDSSASGKGLAHSLRCVFSYADPKTYVKDGNVCIKQEQCSLDDYPLNSCPEHGTCSSKTCDGTTKYKLNSCESGYKVNDGMCELNDVLCICPSAGDVDYQCRFPSVVGVWGTLSQTSDSCGNESVCTICYWDGKYVREIITLKHGADGVRCETGAVGNTDKPVIVISGSGWYELVDSTNAPVGSEPKGEYNMSKYSLIYTNSSTTLAKSYLELTGTYDSIKNQLINDNTYYLAFKTEAECESAIDQYFPDGETVVVDVMEVPEYN